MRGHSHHTFPTFADEKRRLLAAARAAGMRTVDFFEDVTAYRDATGSQLAAFALYIDHVHPSRQGVEIIADHLLPRPTASRP